MSHDETPRDESAPGRREAVREKAQLVHAQQSRARMLRRSALAAGVVAAVAVVAVVVSWAIGSAVGRPQLAPAVAHGDGFVVTSVTAEGSVDSLEAASPAPEAEPQGDASATPTPSATASAVVDIHVYVDYLSPGARDWQVANSQQLSSWVRDGAVTLTYHPVSMLTAKSNGTKYSLRAASAAACVASYAPAAFFAFNDDLLKRQPAVDSDGWSDKELADIAQAHGSDDPTTLRDCIETEAYASWVKAATERAITSIPGADDLSLTGTPMIVVDDQQYVGELTDPAEFSQFVLTSASGAYQKARSATPTPTSTPAP
ncbi:DsbA family protein [Microbacterium sp.]|uniref:DsbA family protein n=1 Tax=Microbacterium sp. TaxID=51671 RepID=UPI003C752372